jgi:hypothetical protein
MSKHTPGPWRWWETANGARIAGHPADGSRNFVCDVTTPERDVSFRANACLIAAAPDLMAALYMMLEGSQADCGCVRLPSDKAVKAAFAAIAKATKETA